MIHLGQSHPILKLFSFYSCNLTSLNFGNGIIKEPLGGTHSHPDKMYKKLKTEIKRHITKLLDINPKERIDQRIDKFCNMGVYK